MAACRPWSSQALIDFQGQNRHNGRRSKGLVAQGVHQWKGMRSKAKNGCVAKRMRPLLLSEEERHRLLFGPYEPPLVKRGFLVDALRGKVPFGTFTNALIPWPKARRRGKSGSGGIVLCGDLLRALEKESIPAVSYYWGVSRATVGNWRRALEMKGRTAGAQRLVSLGVELAKLPESRKKIAEAARGRVLSATTKSRLFAGIHRGWRERFKARQAAFRRTGRFPKATKSDPWIPEEEKLLPELPTSELVRVLGRSSKSIQARRIYLGIRFRPPAKQEHWEDGEVKLLGTAPDAAVARQLGRSVASVEAKRRKLGIQAAGTNYWTTEEEAIVGKVPDAEAARRLGRTEKAVQHHRHKLGMAFFHVENARRWTPQEEALLGTDLDKAIAESLNRTVRSVAIKRREMGITPKTKVCPWTPEEVAVLGTMSDPKVARKLNRTLLSVRTKRDALGIAPGINRRWTPAEDALVGQLPDDEVARKLGRPVGAVRMRRAFLGRTIFAPKVRRWSKDELDLLGVLPDLDVAKRTGRTSSAVQDKRERLRIPVAK